MNTERLTALAARERARFVAARPRSATLAERAAPHFPGGVPMHWMTDWGTPFPLCVREARGAVLTDVDDQRYVDFCLGDTGAMYGHSPPAIAAAVGAQAARGLATMLPGEALAEVGERLAQLFGLPHWQIALSATDANRAVLRWARAVTKRPRVLLFDGCYHGTVDETLVRGDERGGARARPGLVGAPFDPSTTTRVVPFNDLDALTAALAAGDVAALLCEPVMTNAGMVLPEPQFLEQAFAAARRHDALVVLDETHTLSSGLGGYGRTHRLAADGLVCGKAIAGGVPCAVYGVSADWQTRIDAFMRDRSGGHSGIGTTLAANPLSVAALLASLREVMTAPNHALMDARAAELEAGLRATFTRLRLDWHVSRVGARTEFGFGPAPRNARDAERQMRPELERLIHLSLLNRGYLLTPFHNMLLTSPVTTATQVAGVVDTLAAVLTEVIS